MLNPIAPHWTEYMYKTYLNPIFKNNKQEQHVVEFLSRANFPAVESNIDSKLFYYNRYIKTVIQTINDLVNQKLSAAKGKKDKKGGKEEKKEEEETKLQSGPYTGVIRIYYAPQFTLEQQRVFNILKAAEYNEANQIQTDYKKIIMEEMKKSDANLRTLTLQFASFIVREIETYGMEVLSDELPFNELTALKDNMSLISNLTKAANIDIVVYSDKNKPKGAKTIAIPGKPLIFAE